MKLTTVTLPAVSRSVLTLCPVSSRSTKPGTRLSGGSSWVPAGGGEKLGAKTPLTNSSSRLSASWPRAAPGARVRARRSAVMISARRHIRAHPRRTRPALRARAEALAAEVHDVGAPHRVKVGGELCHQLPVLPGIRLEPVVAGLVPLRQQRVGRVDALAVPGRRDHVRHLAELHRLHELALEGIRHVIDAQATVAEGIDVDHAVIGGDADIDGKIGPDLRDVLGRPGAVG